MAKEEKIIFTDEQNNGGRGAWFLERFLFWGREANRSTIFLDRTVERINHIFVYLTWLLIFGGWLSFGWWVYLNVDSLIQDPWTILWFWKNFDPLIFFFLSTLWLDLFLFYRHCLKKDFSQRINYRRLDKKPSRHSRKKYNIAAGFSDEAIRLIDDAYILAARLKQPEVAVIHLFRSLLKSKDIQNLFIRLNTDAKRLIEMVDRRLVKPVKVTRQEGRRRFSGPTEEIFVQAFIDAYRLRQKSVDVFNLIAFCAQRDPYLEEILLELEIDQDKIKNVVAWFRVNRRLLDNYNNYRRLAILKPGGNMNRSYTAIATPTLERYARDLTVDAKYGALDICVGRDKEIEAIFEAFTGGHNGVLLVGQPGTGKSTIIGGLAQLMVAENVPIFLKDKRLLELDIPRLVSGASASEVSERLLICINEARRSGNIIFYIDNLENLLGSSSGANEGLNLSEVLAEAISRKSIFCLAAATKENYSRFIETEAIGDLMTTVGVSEPEVNEAIQMLESKVGFLEHKYDIYIVYSALEQAVVMSKHYINDKYLPLKAFNLLEKAVIGTSRNEKDGTTFCGGEQVAAAVSEITGIPLSKITTSEREKLLSLESEIHKRLIGQHEAVEAVSASLRRARAALKDSKRPIASFLFLGPTGVGKTELAKSVSQVYFGDEDYLVRIDMSEYQAADSIRKMIGDVDGTVGYLLKRCAKNHSL